MAVKIADIFANLTVKTDEYDRGLSAAQGRASSFGNILQGVFQGIGQRLFSGIISGVDTFVSKIGEAVAASSDLSESVNQTGQIFGSSAQKIIDFAGTADVALGQSKRQALDAASTFATFGKSAGLTGDQLVDFSTKFVTLASDMASFKNTSPEEAITAIGAALRGESEPIRRYGVLLDEATLKHRALALGIISTTDQALTPQQKVLAATAEIYRQTGDIQGDFTRTSEGLANAQRILAAEFENGSAKLGDTFRPAVESITNSLVSLAPTMFQYAQAAMDQFANGLAAGIRAILPVITTVRELFTYWFKPGSPPKILPDIDKWGAGTMKAYLEGFTSLDIKSAFDTVGRAIETILRSDVAAGKGDEQGLVGRILGSQNAIQAAVSEFRQLGSVSDSTIARIARNAGSAGAGIANLVKSYFDLQKATDAVNRAQNQLNDITARYDSIISPLQSQLNGVRAEQQKLADQQRLIAARNTLNNFDSTDAEKRAAQLEIEQITLEAQINSAEAKKKAETDAAQTGLDSAKKQQDAAQKQLDIAQATIDQRVQTNNLLGEQRQLEERLAQQREADAKRAAAEAEQAANKAKQQQEQAERLAEQLHQAQLRYNLEIADTPGKIKLLEAELARAKVGTVEYFQTLTEIHRLQEQQKREAEQAAKKAAGADIGGIGGGIDANLTKPLGEASKAGENLANALKQAFGPLPEATGKVKELADKITLLVDKLAALFGIDFSSFKSSTQDAATTAGGAWDMYGERAAAAEATVKTSTDSTAANMIAFVGVLNDLVDGNWAALWEKYKAYAMDAYSATDTDTAQKLANMQTAFTLFHAAVAGDWSTFWQTLTTAFSTATSGISASWGAWLADLSKTMGQWLTDEANAIGQWFTDLGTKFYNGGAGIIGQFWDGLKSKWGEVESWFTSSLQSLRNQLPFSEPKDPTSPLRGLAKSGAAMVEMLQSGIASASLTVNPLADSLLPAGATTNNNTSNAMTFNININGGGVDVGKSAKDGVLSALRAAGLA